MASLQLARARAFYKSGQFADAKKTIDSLIKASPKAFKQIDAGYALLDSVRYGQNFKVITESESLLKKIDSLINEKKGSFAYVFDSRYQSTGNYIPKIYPMAQTTGLYSGVNSDGEFFLESVSTQSIKHNRVTLSDGATSVSSAVVTDDGANFRFSAGGKSLETVHYSQNRVNGIGEFVQSNQNKNMVVSLSGASSTRFPLSSSAKKGIVDSYEFAKLFAQRDSARFKIARSQQLIKYLDSKRAKEMATRATNQLMKKK